MLNTVIWTATAIVCLALIYAGLRIDMREMKMPPRRKRGDPDWRNHPSTKLWAWMNRDRLAPGQYDLPVNAPASPNP